MVKYTGDASCASLASSLCSLVDDLPVAYHLFSGQMTLSCCENGSEQKETKGDILETALSLQIVPSRHRKRAH